MKTLILLLVIYIPHFLLAQFFEGKINYSVSTENNSSIPDSVFRMMFQNTDENELLIYSNGNYKSVTNAGKSITIYNQEEKGVQYSFLKDSKFGSTVNLIETKNLPTIETKIETESILGMECKKVIFEFKDPKYGNSTFTFFYNNQIKIDSTHFSEVNNGPLELFFKNFSTIPLKKIVASDIAKHKIICTATNIEAIAIDNKSFKIPKFKNLIEN